MSDPKTCRTDRMDVERFVARTFVLGGGLFWIVAAFAAEYGFRGAGIAESLGNASWPAALTLIVFALGCYDELATVVLLAVGVMAAVGWGITFAWEPAVWALMAVVLIGPMVAAGVLYFSAARMELICENPDSIGSLVLVRNAFDEAE